MPVEAVKELLVVLLFLKLPAKVTGEAAVSLHVPVELIVTSPLKVLVPVALTMLSAPFTVVGPVTVRLFPEGENVELVPIVSVPPIVVTPESDLVPPVLVDKLLYVYAPTTCAPLPLKFTVPPVK